MSRTRKVVLICTSPKAGSGKRRDFVPELTQQLENKGFQTVVSSDVQEIRADAIKHDEAGQLRAVLSAGGDGTLSLVAANVPPSTPLLPIPMGTENLMARYLGHALDVSQVVATVEAGVSVQMDAGMANDQLFLIMVSAGFDAEVVRRLAAVRRGHIWKLSYLLPTLRAMASYRFPNLIASDDSADPDQLSGRWAFVFNAPRYAMGLPIAYWSNPSDGALDLVTLRRGSIFSMFQYALRICRRQHRTHRDVSTALVQSITIESENPEQKVPYQLDGDFAGYLPVKVTLLRRRVNLMLPPNVEVNRNPELEGALREQDGSALAVT